ncbi:TPA: hypothetical protein ACH3X2_004838 [Trebouxia sp. C0005]
MSSRRKRSPEPSSSSSSSSDSGTSSGSDSSSSSDSRSSASPQVTNRREPPRGAAKKRQRSPSPQPARHAARTRGEPPREQHRSSRHTATGSDRQRTSPQRPHRHAQSPVQQQDRSSRDMSRRKQYGDQGEGSRAESHREPVEGTRHRDREPSSRNREPSDRDRAPSNRDREPSSRDRQPHHESRDQSDGRHARHERHGDRNMDVNGGNDTTKSNRRSSRQDHQEPARDQAALAPAPTQSSAHQPEGDNRGQGAAGSGNPGRQNRWAKNVDAGPEQWGKPGNQPDAKQGKEEKPEPEANFALSGKLAAESNTVKGVVLVHQEPPEARKPSQMWRLYGFKNGEPIDKPLYIHRQTCYLFGRERRVADVPLDHPSISKQHAVMQYRRNLKFPKRILCTGTRALLILLVYRMFCLLVKSWALP